MTKLMDDAEVTVNGVRWRLTWDDDELCDHILLFNDDPRFRDGGAWYRVGVSDATTLWSENILPWLVVELLLDRRNRREALFMEHVAAIDRGAP